MKARTQVFVLLLCLVALAVSGCRRNIVLASPPSVTSPPPSEPPVQPTVASSSRTETKSVTPPPSASDSAESATTEPAPAAAVRAAAPRPRPTPVGAEPPKPKAEPEPQPPQISPELTPTLLAEAQRRTTDDLRFAENIVQLASSKQLNASQNDLYGKIKGFDKDAHEAITANDWVRAQNLAQKARVLSDELRKSL